MAVNELAGYGQFTRVDPEIDKEILYSTEGILLKGGVISSGQNLASGTVLGRVTATGEWVAYSNGASDGSEVARGVLAKATDATGGDKHANIYFAGTFKTASLVGLDANAITDFGARQDTAYGWTRIP